eukprot:TRINITY_DN3123_c0_g1_i1.p1 TRINITY_DN3123_c0_g1~~TRINITY_DN3123_c0_g1_i1.p1  ORF type:complete len:1615 (+),score=466.51 TRINITY_DN3123_c0_g1_i1:96-4940(+)
MDECNFLDCKMVRATYPAEVIRAVQYRAKCDLFQNRCRKAIVKRFAERISPPTEFNAIDDCDEQLIDPKLRKLMLDNDLYHPSEVFEPYGAEPDDWASEDEYAEPISAAAAELSSVVPFRGEYRTLDEVSAAVGPVHQPLWHAILQQIQTYEHAWQATEKPKVDAREIWMKLQLNALLLAKCVEEIDQRSATLVKNASGILSTAGSVAEAVKLCGALQNTVERLCYLRYQMDIEKLSEIPAALAKAAKLSVARGASAAGHIVDEGEEVGNNSDATHDYASGSGSEDDEDSDSNTDSMGSFIDDSDLPKPATVVPAKIALTFADIISLSDSDSDGCVDAGENGSQGGGGGGSGGTRSSGDSASDAAGGSYGTSDDISMGGSDAGAPGGAGEGGDDDGRREKRADDTSASQDDEDKPPKKKRAVTGSEGKPAPPTSSALDDLDASADASVPTILLPAKVENAITISDDDIDVLEFLDSEYRQNKHKQSQVDNDVMIIDRPAVKRAVPVKAQTMPDEMREAWKQEKQRQTVLKKRQDRLSQSQPSQEPYELDFRFTAGPHQGDFLINPGHDEAELDCLLEAGLAEKLYPHQRHGLRFMFDNISANLGCLLAHGPGLGKTVSIISFSNAYSNFLFDTWRVQREAAGEPLNNPPRATFLVVVPKSVLMQWQQEYAKWQQPLVRRMYCWAMDFQKFKTANERVGTLQEWKRRGGVMIMTYQQVANMLENKASKSGAAPLTKTQHDLVKAALQTPGADVVVVDEAHSMAQPKTRITQWMKSMATRRRIALTGSPLQNHLEEYWCMLDWVRPDILHSQREFKRLFAQPINAGMQVDASEGQKQRARRRAGVLNRKLAGFVHRLDDALLDAKLPGKREYVILCRLSPLQNALYRKYLENISDLPDFEGENSTRAKRSSIRRNPIMIHSSTVKILNHPEVLLRFLKKNPDLVKPVIRKSIKPASAGPTFDAHGMPQAVMDLNREILDDDDLDVDQYLNVTNVDEDELSAKDTGYVGMDEVFRQYKYDPSRVDWRASGKMSVLLFIAKASIERREKLLVFSRCLTTLDVIQLMMPTYIKGVRIARMDGSTAGDERLRIVERFNNTNQLDVLLMSKVGNLGLNVCGGSRLVLFDVGWNPAEVEQAIHRIYRFGQQKHVYTYRLVTYGTAEHVRYRLQVDKQGLSRRVVDNQPTERHFSKRELQDQMYELREPPADMTDTAADRMGDSILSDMAKDPLCGPLVVGTRDHMQLLQLDDAEIVDANEMEECIAEYEAEAAGKVYGQAPPPALGPSSAPGAIAGMAPLTVAPQPSQPVASAPLPLAVQQAQIQLLQQRQQYQLIQEQARLAALQQQQQQKLLAQSKLLQQAQATSSGPKPAFLRPAATAAAAAPSRIPVAAAPPPTNWQPLTTASAAVPVVVQASSPPPPAADVPLEIVPELMDIPADPCAVQPYPEGPHSHEALESLQKATIERLKLLREFLRGVLKDPRFVDRVEDIQTTFRNLLVPPVSIDQEDLTRLYKCEAWALKRLDDELGVQFEKILNHTGAEQLNSRVIFWRKFTPLVQYLLLIAVSAAQRTMLQNMMDLVSASSLSPDELSQNLEILGHQEDLVLQMLDSRLKLMIAQGWL